jgi:predicted O-methyltransferase YrrM
MKKYLKAKLESLFSSLAKKKDLDNLFIQLSALLEIKEIIGPGLLLGPFREWALSPDALLMLLREVTSRSDPQIIEFGSGESTIAIAAALRAGGSGHVIAIEHDPEFAKVITARLRSNNLIKYADVRVVEMVDCNSKFSLPPSKSYNLIDLDSDFDISLVDGPIMMFGPATRAVPLEYCLRRLDADRVIYLDDAARTDEQNVLKAYLSNFPNLCVQYLNTEKGLARLTKKQNLSA